MRKIVSDLLIVAAFGIPLFAAVAGLLGCGNSPGAQFPSESEVRCIVAVLSPGLKDGFDGENLAKRIVAKQASAGEVLDALKGDVNDAKAIVKAIEACGQAPDAG